MSNIHVRKPEFLEFIKSVIEYFKLHFKVLLLRESIRRDSAQFNSRLHQKELHTLQTSKRDKFLQLGMSYAGVILGTGALSDLQFVSQFLTFFSISVEIVSSVAKNRWKRAREIFLMIYYCFLFLFTCLALLL